MNVIVSNKQKGIIDGANIDAIKDLNGLFNVDDLVNKFKNYFFTKMIVDATSIVDFASEEVLKKLVDEIGSDRLIILLPSTPEPPDEFKKLLVDLKIYNFSNKIEDVVKFIDSPNTYENAISSIANPYNDNSGFYVDNSIKEDNPNDDLGENNNEEYNGLHSSLGDIMNKMSINNSNFNNSNDDLALDEDFDDNHSSFEMNDYNSVFQDNVVSDDKDSNESSENKEEFYESPIEESNEKEEFNVPISNGVELEENTNERNIFLNTDEFEEEESFVPSSKYVIGFRNVTKHAGSTTLIYMLHNVAKKNNKDVLSLEIDKNDFHLFHKNKMVSVNSENLQDTLNSAREEIIFIDLNNYLDDSMCDEVIYLVEPSVIRLNDLMLEDKTIFEKLHDKKVVLNKCMLSDSDIPILEKEANMKFFFKIGAVNDRIDNNSIEELFSNLTN